MATALPRITARVDVDTQELLSQAAAIAGMSSINSFVLSAALEKANTIMERERSLKLSQKDTTALMNALDKPAKSNDKLQQAALRYMDKKQ
ncbi:DUF1778 domain-containing protein [Psychromonas sp. MME2]|uniref:type II toxin-antitoxin system TacA family antitoxin n=1 Tax=unclassified Psychromonas TaxID=2614957 RepID=UPI00339BA09A